jgi:hypothetical protein
MPWVAIMYVFGLLFYVYLGYLAWKAHKDENSVHAAEWSALGVACFTLCVVIFKAASVAHGIPL